MMVMVTMVAAPAANADPDLDPKGYAGHLADQLSNAWYRGTGGWRPSDGFGGTFEKPAPCAELLAGLRRGASSRIRSPSSSGPTRLTIRPGRRTLAEVRPACDHIRRVGLVHAWEKLAQMAASEHAKLSVGGGYDIRFFNNCVSSYNDLIKAGITPTERVLEDKVTDGHGGKLAWTGTVEELRTKWCDAGVAKAGELRTAEEEPYRKVLKADKLRLALEQRSFIIPGGASTTDPKQLAKADAWFVDLSAAEAGTSTCSNGKDKHTVRRHQFNGAHVLVKTTTKDYCGSPPSSAFH